MASLLAVWLLVPAIPATGRLKTADILRVLLVRDVRMGLVTTAIVLTAQFATYTYITPFLAQLAGLGGTTISALLLGYTLIGVLGNFAGGAIAGKHVRIAFAGVIALFIGSVGILPMVAGSETAVVLALGLWGIAYGALPVVQQMWIMDSAGKSREAASSLLAVNFQVAIASGAFVGGQVVDRMGLASSMSFGAVLAMVGLFWLWRSSFVSGRKSSD